MTGHEAVRPGWVVGPVGALTAVELPDPGAPCQWWRDPGVLAALGVGTLLRLVLLASSELWHDEATTGIMGLAVLRGERPVHFYGQPFMGALDAYLSAALYALLGASARTLELLPVLISLAWLGLETALAAEAFGLRAARFAAVLLALPPYPTQRRSGARRLQRSSGPACDGSTEGSSSAK